MPIPAPSRSLPRGALAAGSPHIARPAVFSSFAGCMRRHSSAEVRVSPRVIRALRSAAVGSRTADASRPGSLRCRDAKPAPAANVILVWCVVFMLQGYGLDLGSETDHFPILLGAHWEQPPQTLGALR